MNGKECGYRLRCKNYGKKCSVCSRHMKDAKKDYLVDILKKNGFSHADVL